MHLLINSRKMILLLVLVIFFSFSEAAAAVNLPPCPTAIAPWCEYAGQNKNIFVYDNGLGVTSNSQGCKKTDRKCQSDKAPAGACAQRWAVTENGYCVICRPRNPGTNKLRCIESDENVQTNRCIPSIEQLRSMQLQWALWNDNNPADDKSSENEWYNENGLYCNPEGTLTPGVWMPKEKGLTPEFMWGSTSIKWTGKGGKHKLAEKALAISNVPLNEKTWNMSLSVALVSIFLVLAMVWFCRSEKDATVYTELSDKTEEL